MSQQSGLRIAASRAVRPGVLFAALGLVMLATPGAPASDTLDRELLKNAPKIIRYLKDHGYKNVGALKFRVKKGDEPIGDHVGPLNLNLADRLEIALILADDVRNPIGVIHGASAVAATLPGANHLTRPGRQALFRGRYPLAWGDQKVEADVFLTGVVVVSPDLGQMSVGIMAFGKDGEALEKVVDFRDCSIATGADSKIARQEQGESTWDPLNASELAPNSANGLIPSLIAWAKSQLPGNVAIVSDFTATTDAPALVEVGESFMTRGAFDGGRVEVVKDQAASEEAVRDQVVKTAARVKSAQVMHPLQDPEAPVALEVFYDNQRVPLQLQDGKALIAEPHEGQTVLFVLRKVDKTPGKYGVVLSVNGENTLYKERLSPLQCWKWILSPETPAISDSGVSDRREVSRVIPRPAAGGVPGECDELRGRRGDGQHGCLPRGARYEDAPGA